jgi:hypothetical protein
MVSGAVSFAVEVIGTRDFMGALGDALGNSSRHLAGDVRFVGSCRMIVFIGILDRRRTRLIHFLAL